MKLSRIALLCFILTAAAQAGNLIATSTTNGIRLNLTTLADSKIARYEIYRSPTAESDFTLVGSLPALKSSINPQRYEFLDQNVTAGITYYYYYAEASPTNVFRSHRQEMVSASSIYNILPESYSLQAFPNPFNPNTTVSFNVREAGDISVAVYDVMGRSVATLATGNLSAGEHKVNFDGTNLPSGIYVARMESKGYSASQDLMLVK